MNEEKCILLVQQLIGSGFHKTSTLWIKAMVKRMERQKGSFTMPSLVEDVVPVVEEVVSLVGVVTVSIVVEVSFDAVVGDCVVVEVMLVVVGVIEEVVMEVGVLVVIVDVVVAFVVSFRTKLALSLFTKPTFDTERISSLKHLLPC